MKKISGKPVLPIEKHQSQGIIAYGQQYTNQAIANIRG
jgi:hypothetical protein